MNEAKLQLSADEMNLATNKDIILTKQRVVKKVCELMGILSAQMQDHLGGTNFLLAPEMVNSSSKISKGEQYQQMPMWCWITRGFFRKSMFLPFVYSFGGDTTLVLPFI